MRMRNRVLFFRSSLRKKLDILFQCGFYLLFSRGEPLNLHSHTSEAFVISQDYSYHIVHYCCYYANKYIRKVHVYIKTKRFKVK